jgi:ABC-type cobalt transport system, ATPase component
MIEFKNVSYVYGTNTPFQKTAVDNLSFTIEQGIVTGLIGHTGSGKSTVAQMMNALMRPTSGEVLFEGKNIWGKSVDTYKLRFRVGLVFQYPEYQLFEETVERDIAFGPKNMGLPEAEIKQRVENAAQFTGLSQELLKKSPFELSGGQKRRAAIAGVIAMDPDVLVLDEPAAGLDPKGRADILGGLIAYRKKRGNTLVLISHSMEDIANYSDKILAMSKGKLLSYGTPSEVFSHNEALVASGLMLPQVTEILHKLKLRGMDVNQSIYTVEDAVKELVGKLPKRGSN